MVTPLVKHKIVKKRTKKFKRHQSDRFDRVGESWRRPKGIDSRVRRRFRSNIRLPSVGFGTNKNYRHVLPNGFLKFRVKNAKELEMLLMQNRKYCAEIAGNVSAKKRRHIVARAAQLNIKVANPNGRLSSEEQE